MFLVQFAAGAILFGAPLVVETTSPDALCPDLASARKAVADRLGALNVGVDGWVASYVVVRTPGGQGDHLLLELWSPDKERRLKREIPLYPGACPTMAVGIAAVLERFFADLTTEDESENGDEGDEHDGARPRAAETSTPSPEESAGAGPPRGPPLTPREPVESAVLPEPPLPPVAPSATETARWSWWLGATLGLGTSEVASDLRPELGFAVGVVAPRFFELGVMGNLSRRSRDETSTLEGTEVESRAHQQTLRAFGRYRLGDETWRLALGPEILIAVESASARPSTTQRTERRVLPGVGVGTSLTWSLRPTLALGLAGSVDWTWADRMARFTYSWKPAGATDESTREVLVPRHVNGFFGLFLQVAPGR